MTVVRYKEEVHRHVAVQSVLPRHDVLGQSNMPQNDETSLRDLTQSRISHPYKLVSIVHIPFHEDNLRPNTLLILLDLELGIPMGIRSRTCTNGSLVRTVNECQDAYPPSPAYRLHAAAVLSMPVPTPQASGVPNGWGIPMS